MPKNPGRSPGCRPGPSDENCPRVPGHECDGTTPKPVKDRVGGMGHTQPLLPPCHRRIAIVDDDESVHISVRKTLKSHAGGWELDSYLTPQSALDAIPRSEMLPEVVLMDIGMPVLSGIDCTRRLKASLPRLPVVMFAAYLDSADIVESVTVGACGYLLKTTSPERLVWALGEAALGRIALCSAAQVALVDYVRRLGAARSSAGLSRRERDVMLCVMQGHLNKDIASRLGISEGTVHRHLSEAYKKLDVHGRDEARRMFIGG